TGFTNLGGHVITATVLHVKYPLSSYQVEEILGLFRLDVSARTLGRCL
ncbi:unnamed protein product, partial [marine sediment metagenome]